jgi:tRNA-dependent cyclodipeptide synthase
MRQKDSNYPTQNGQYIVKVKSGDDWKLHDTCRLHISVGQPYHEGEKLKATVEWAVNRFKKVTICVNDTLQYTNLMFEHSLDRDDAMNMAWEAGQSWIKRNHSIISGCKIVHWDEWKRTPLYIDMLNAVGELVISDPTIRQSLSDTAMGIWNRRYSVRGDYSIEQREYFLKLSHEYLTTEMAVIGVMIACEPAIDIYPGTMLPVFDLLKGQSLGGVAQYLTQRSFARIDFTRNDAGSNSVPAAKIR